MKTVKHATERRTKFTATSNYPTKPIVGRVLVLEIFVAKYI